MALNATRHPHMTDAIDGPAAAAHGMRGMVGGVVRAIGAIVVFGAFTAGMALMWEHAFGFPVGEAWALSLGLSTTIAMLVAVLVIVVLAVKQEEDALLSGVGDQIRR
ncbi:MAG: hypothetical protein AB7R89_19230 [Dehalococcoidia bacterium]